MQSPSTRKSRPQMRSGRLFTTTLNATTSRALQPATAASGTNLAGGGPSNMATTTAPARAAPAPFSQAPAGIGGAPKQPQRIGPQAPQPALTSTWTKMSTLPCCIYAAADAKPVGPKLGCAVTWGGMGGKEADNASASSPLVRARRE